MDRNKELMNRFGKHNYFVISDGFVYGRKFGEEFSEIKLGTIEEYNSYQSLINLMGSNEEFYNF
jgi:hypothetical protein